MSDPKTPAINWTSSPIIEPRSAETQCSPRDAALAELDQIIDAAGGFPGDPDTSWPKQVATPARDPAAVELLAPASGRPLAEFSTPPTASPAAPLTFEQALRNGTIPTYEERPADVAVDPEAPALDSETERAAWQQLMEFIHKNKDAGTTVAMVDLDTFTKGLT